MLLSFSVPEMRPMIEAGLRQRAGEDMPEGTRVQRQAIRARGPQWLRVLAASEGGNAAGGKVNRDLHLWWKSRTKDRAVLGTVRGFEAYPVSISHDRRDPARHSVPGFVTLALPYVTCGREVAEWRLYGPDSAASRERNTSSGIAYADGFDQWMDFVRFFVPEPGDRFVGVLIKW